jgi:hypothetical protein
MRRREPPFIGGEEGFLGKCFIPSWKAPNQPQTDVLGMLNLAIPYGTIIAKAIADNT